MLVGATVVVEAESGATVAMDLMAVAMALVVEGTVAAGWATVATEVAG
jgi:hypothetical protein